MVKPFVRGSSGSWLARGDIDAEQVVQRPLQLQVGEAASYHTSGLLPTLLLKVTQPVARLSPKRLPLLL